MTNKELIEALAILKEQARHSGVNTFVWDINIDSFNFVIDSTIKALSQEPTTKNDLGVDAVSRQAVLELIADYDLSMGQVVKGIHALPSVTPQEPILEKINKMKSEIADSLEFWDYSPNNNPLARDMLETLTNFWGDIKAEVEP